MPLYTMGYPGGVENYTFCSRNTGREIIVLGDIDGYRYYSFVDSQDVILQFSLSNAGWKWEDHFCLGRSYEELPVE